MRLSPEVVDDGLFEGGFILGGPRLATALDLTAPYLSQHAGGLLATHDRYAGIRPHKQKVRIVGSSAHTVIACTIGIADDQRQLGHLGTGHSGDHLGAVFGDATSLILFAHHKARDVL